MSAVPSNARYSCSVCGQRWFSDYYVHFCPGPRTYPIHEPLKISDYYTCETCGQGVFTTLGQHLCPGPPQRPVGGAGWLCPACGKGNAPFVAQCPCEGRQGSSWTSNEVVVTGTATGGYMTAPEDEGPEESQDEDDGRGVGFCSCLPDAERTGIIRMRDCGIPAHRKEARVSREEL